MNYGYDSLYRLTSETIAGDPSNINGAVNYTYDAVGNRKQIASTLVPVPAGLFNYDANDRFTAGDTEACPERSRRDNDGNTVSSGGIANVYVFENHVVQKGGVTLSYDGRGSGFVLANPERKIGNRVSKTVAGVTTTYLVDSLNPTGYAQVVYETFSGSSAPNRELNHVYVYGLELLGQTRNYVANSQSNTQQIYYGYDGHGSVRALTDPNGSVTDKYDYDAFGNLIHSTGTTPNNYLFAGEQFDSDLNLYYNRARYLNTSTGRFWTIDTFDGDASSPSSLHKYLFAGSEPVLGTDPSGNVTLMEEEEVAGESAAEDVEQLQILQTGQRALNLAKFAAAVATGVALAAEGDSNPPPSPPSGEEDRRKTIPLYRDADGTNPGAFGFTTGSCPFITSEVSLLEMPKRDKAFTIRFTARFDPPQVTCVTKGSIIDPDLADLGLGVVYSPTLTTGHWSLIAKSYVPTKDEQEAIKKRLSLHAKDTAYQH